METSPSLLSFLLLLPEINKELVKQGRMFVILLDLTELYI